MTAPAYPGLGAPCNGCGFCCRSRPCDLARDFAGVREGPCPCLVAESNKLLCGLVVEPHKHVIGMAGKPWADPMLSGMFATMLGIGKGCDSASPAEAA